METSHSSLAGKRYLVTGAAGFIGTALVRALIKNGNVVRGLDNESRGLRDRLRELESRIEWIEGDVRDADTVAKAVRGVDAVFHLAAVNGTEFFYSRPELVLEVAVKGIMNVLDACVAEGVGELFLASSFRLGPWVLEYSRWFWRGLQASLFKRRGTKPKMTVRIPKSYR